MMEHRFPVVLGKDFAGTVESVGSGVSRFTVGEPVFGVVIKHFVGDGAFGEYVTVPEGMGIAHRPDALDLASAGVLELAGTAALQSVGAVQPLEGQTLLVPEQLVVLALSPCNSAPPVAHVSSPPLAPVTRHSLYAVSALPRSWTTRATYLRRFVRSLLVEWTPCCTLRAMGRRWRTCSCPVVASHPRWGSAPISLGTSR